MKFSLPAEKLLKNILGFAQKRKIKLYLVGGILRDMLLGREKDNPDIDFCLKNQSINFGKALAGELKAGFVVLDYEHGACRLIKKINNQTFTLDFTDFRAATLEKDLLHRDFTINAMALDLEDAFGRAGFDRLIIDPYSGRKDLSKEIIRPVNHTAFDEDPLRILRAFSFACILSFSIDPKALKLIKSKKAKLSAVSTERIREELFKILHTPRAHIFFEMMDKIGILECILPEIKFMRNVNQGPYHHLDVWQHSLRTLKEIEMAIDSFRNNSKIVEYLDQIISSQRKRLALIKLGALLHDIGKPKARRRVGKKLIFHGHERYGLDFVEDIAARLKLSNDELQALKKMVLWHLRPGYLADNQRLSNRAVFRYFRDTALESLSVLLISLADQRSTRGRLTTKLSRSRHEKLVSLLIKEYFRRKEEKVIVKFINGNDLIKKYKLKPSVLIGKILRAVEEAQAIGKIKTRGQAFKLAQRFLKK